MIDITLDKRITKVGDAAKEAFSELHKIQQKERLLLKTGEEMIKVLLMYLEVIFLFCIFVLQT